MFVTATEIKFEYYSSSKLQVSLLFITLSLYAATKKCAKKDATHKKLGNKKYVAIAQVPYSI